MKNSKKEHFKLISMLFFLFILIFSFIGTSMAATYGVRKINQNDFEDFETLDMQTFPHGPISSTDQLFQDFGLEYVTAECSAPTGDENENYPALWGDYPEGVKIVSVGEGSPGRTLPPIRFYDLKFKNPITRSGFFCVDVWAPINFTFKLDGQEVARYENATGWTEWQLFETDTPFDQVILENYPVDGFGISIIIVDRAQLGGDTTPPEIDLDVLTGTLWPPNHKMVKVAQISATDDSDPAPILSVEVSSNEPLNGPGDGNTNADWEWDAATGELYLRAERAGGKSGRIYTVTVTASDESENTSTESFEVTVPHNKKGRPKNIGDLFTENESGMPGDYLLSQNYPNPFNPTTEITFALPNAETVKLSIYNTSGQLIHTLVNGFYSEGFHSVMWNATDESGSRVTSGMYMYVLQAGETVLQNKMLLMK